MKIVFDAAKRLVTLQTRGLDMADAGAVFETALLTIDDKRYDYGEDRFMTVGYLDGRMVVVVWTWRGGACRIISLRKANEREQEAYRPRL
jgi:uncharacterized protein